MNSFLEAVFLPIGALGAGYIAVALYEYVRREMLDHD